MMRTEILLVSLTLIACSPQAPLPVETAGTPAAPVAVAPAPTKADVGPAEAAATLVLRGDGITVEENKVMAFGTPADQVVANVGALFGRPPGNVQTLDECGEGALELSGWDNGFTAYSQEGAFVGWTSIDHRTAEGIGFGSTRAQLDAAYHPQVEESSLGLEFQADGLSGILESDAPDATISEFWAGMTCIMR